MLTRFLDRFKFGLERTLVRGAQYRFLVVAALIGLISLFGGVLVLIGTGDFDSIGEAIWWAFLRLSDPGYLGDDTGTVRRTVSTILTVLGYVVFLGALVAIMTQWLNSTMRRLESGLTPVARKGHILILGWTNRTATIVGELLLSQGRVRRFLQRHGARDLHIVVLVDEVTAERVQDLRARVGEAWDGRKVTLRSGSPLRVEHLERVDFLNASAVVAPGADFAADSSATVDTRTIKTLLSLSNHPGAGAASELPFVTAEILDARKVEVARAAYRGSLEVLASDVVVSRLIAQNVRHRGLSDVYNELLTHSGGNELYVREWPRFVGEPVHSLLEAFPRAVPLGVVREEEDGFQAYLNPGESFRVEPGDRLILLAATYEEASPDPRHKPRPAPRGRPVRPSGGPESRRVLILGWNHKVPALVLEFDRYSDESFEIDIFSSVPARRREQAVRRYGADLRRAGVRQVEGDYTILSELAGVAPTEYDNVILMGSDWLRSGSESDARTLVGYLLLQELFTGMERRPALLVELLDPENAPLLGRRPGEVIISPVILSHMLAQVALRPELRAVFEGLFAAGGTDIFFESATEYDLDGREIRFQDVQAAAQARGETALGLVRTPTGGPTAREVHLNPPRTEVWRLEPEDEIVMLATYDPGGTDRSSPSRPPSPGADAGTHQSGEET